MDQGGIGAEEVIAGGERAELVGTVDLGGGSYIKFVTSYGVDIEVDAGDAGLGVGVGDGALDIAGLGQVEVDILGGLSGLDGDQGAATGCERGWVVEAGEVLGEGGIGAEVIFSGGEGAEGVGAVGGGGCIVGESVAERIEDIEVDAFEGLASGGIGDGALDSATGLEVEVDAADAGGGDDDGGGGEFVLAAAVVGVEVELAEVRVGVCLEEIRPRGEGSDFEGAIGSGGAGVAIEEFSVFGVDVEINGIEGCSVYGHCSSDGSSGGELEIDAADVAVVGDLDPGGLAAEEGLIVVEVDEIVCEGAIGADEVGASGWESEGIGTVGCGGASGDGDTA
ncbi:MAG: hypothetical protein RI897_2178 [Verrucomicrobiota bacterium]